MRSVLIVAVLALVAGLAGYATYEFFEPRHKLVGTAAPDFVFEDTEGRSHQLSAMRGKWVLINFWASWCAPCMHELPLLVEAQARYGAQGLQLLGPALDEPEPVSTAVARFGINYPVSADFLAADTLMQALGNDLGALPYSVLIDPDGRIVEIVLGAFDAESLESLIVERLRASSAKP